MAYDIFFLSHGEPNAELHWQQLIGKFPYAQRVDGIKGIALAHRRCAERSRTDHFFVIDADNVVIGFPFTFRLPPGDEAYVHLWYARNPVNDLEYGWGGIKLFPKPLLLADQPLDIDMTTSFDLKIIPEVASITRFNTSAFDAWRSAFRECVKLAAKRFTIADDMTHSRLQTWCTVGAKQPFGEYAILGATEGRAYGETYQDDLSRLRKINDFDWLRNLFGEHYGTV